MEDFSRGKFLGEDRGERKSAAGERVRCGRQRKCRVTEREGGL